MGQTAVELLEDGINKVLSHLPLEREDIKTLIQQAKQMEKEKSIDFAKYCLNNSKYLNFEKAISNVEDYYQIFKSK